MQTIYIGNTLINDIYLDNKRMDDVLMGLAQIPQNGLVAWYDASNTASYPGSGTTWTDISPSAGSGTIVGSPTFNNTTKLFTFAGSQRVDLSLFLPSGQATYSYFVIAKATGGSVTQVFGQGTETTDRRGFMIRHTGFFGFNGLNNDINNPTGMEVSNNQLKSIAFTLDKNAASALRFYLNGTFISTGNTNAGSSNLNLGTTAARIGTNAANGEGFDGDIGVCMAYNRVLTDLEISQINEYYSTKYTLV
jgi:hypothetical protein